jgi:hypothetical protein
MPAPPEDKVLDDDEAWLELLAGRPVATMEEAALRKAQRQRNDGLMFSLTGTSTPPVSTLDVASRRQAERVRAALIRRKEQMAAAAPRMGDQAFERLLFRMKRERVDSGRAKPLVREPTFIWGIAASLMLATVIIIQQGGFMGGQDDDLVMRSAPEKATIRLVDDVTASRDELMGLLKQAGSEPKVAVVKATGEVVIQVVATQPVLDALAGDPLRIYPEIQDGQITVVLKPTKPKK